MFGSKGVFTETGHNSEILTWFMFPIPRLKICTFFWKGTRFKIQNLSSHKDGFQNGLPNLLDSGFSTNIWPPNVPRLFSHVGVRNWTGLGWRAVGVVRLAVLLASCESNEGYISEILPVTTHRGLVVFGRWRYCSPGLRGERNRSPGFTVGSWISL